MDNRAIGVFDSGLGGLTAAEALSAILPDEHIVYLADSYNMPYGEKDRDRIIQMSRRDLRFLLEKDVKAVFVACGTATSNALEMLERESPVPVFGVVTPAVQSAAKATKNGKIG
ncbi:MAG: aspartate/glutamate racemase family protein, partial [Bacillota bacterium]